jgi:hypothetical protein
VVDCTGFTIAFVAGKLFGIVVALRLLVPNVWAERVIVLAVGA